MVLIKLMLSRTILILLLALNCFLLYQFGWGENSLSRYVELQEQKTELKTRLEKIKQENLALSRQIRNLKNNTRYLKRLIRSKMNLLRSNEVIYLTINSTNASR